jgi:hypothetical protein
MLCGLAITRSAPPRQVEGAQEQRVAKADLHEQGTTAEPDAGERHANPDLAPR